ncbi:hypothetical protein KIKIMORA_03690 [Brevundimonas phage vB_BpoS-Kikimora]|uniref:Uncharacterized protein n=2 Tax=Kikimoravirus TaxID=3425051 RepID=A0A9E7N4K8_9CAUD|nr:hypothetical protein KIKIMORA_03690 [Brevundimonas phage vB_BpoS-Kikimora]UTC28392.1 hypothetical protein GURKE_03720 [Brevundimonas phage vB_BpoS-Gurke]
MTEFRFPGARKYGDPISTYVDPEELENAIEQHGNIVVGRQVARRKAALRIIEQKAQDPRVDRDLLAILHFLVTQ